MTRCIITGDLKTSIEYLYFIQLLKTGFFELFQIKQLNMLEITHGKAIIQSNFFIYVKNKMTVTLQLSFFFIHEADYLYQ